MKYFQKRKKKKTSDILLNNFERHRDQQCETDASHILRCQKDLRRRIIGGLRHLPRSNLENRHILSNRQISSFLDVIIRNDKFD